MNTNDNDIELPPLPEGMILEGIWVVTEDELIAYRDACINAAIEADRKQRHLKEKAQLEQEWSMLKSMQAQYEADRKLHYRPVYEEGWKDALEWADRKRRVEPAVQSDAEVTKTCRAMGANSFAEFFGKTAPQPAEPVKILGRNPTTVIMDGVNPVKVPSDDPFAADRNDWQEMQDTDDGSTEYAVHHQRGGRVARNSITSQLNIPPEKPDPWFEEGSHNVFIHAHRQAYVDGWNACREAFLKEINE